MPTDYDAFLLVSFGGPEGPDDVLPFLENVLRGRNVPRERMLEVAEHYQHFGGVSPINAQNRALIAALEQRVRRGRPQAADLLGQPQLASAAARHAAADAGRRRAAGARVFHLRLQQLFRLPAVSREHRRRAGGGRRGGAADRQAAGLFQSSRLHRADDRADARGAAPDSSRAPDCRRTFAVHGPQHSAGDGPELPVRGALSRGVAAWWPKALGHANWRLVYQSRSGPPTQPWLEPDVRRCTCRDRRRQSGPRDVVVVPIGFISDHMEVLYDLDEEARLKAAATRA